MQQEAIDVGMSTKQREQLDKSTELRLITSIAQDAMNKFSIEKVSLDSIHEWTPHLPFWN
jgi:ribosome maturation protein Sdo1